jgi:hypothetical protein
MLQPNLKRSLPDTGQLPPCQKCGAFMTLTRIEPASPGVDLRTFECSQCGNIEDRLVPFR